MIEGLIGTDSMVHTLKQEMSASMVRSRDIANRVANATNGASASFEASLDEALDADAVDLEVEMVKLADEQIRYQAMSEIVQKMYGAIRSSLRSG